MYKYYLSYLKFQFSLNVCSRPPRTPLAVIAAPSRELASQIAAVARDIGQQGKGCKLYRIWNLDEFMCVYYFSKQKSRDIVTLLQTGLCELRS